MQALRKAIARALPKGFKETIGYGMPGWVVPLTTYPAGYHCAPGTPLPFLGLASQKGHISFYHMGLYADPALLKWFDSPHGRDPLALAHSFGLPAYEAFDRASLQNALDQLYEPHDGPAVLVVRTDAEVSPRVLRDYFKALRPQP